MKRILFFSMALSLMMIGCEKEPEKEVLESWNPSQAKLVGYFMEKNGNRIKVKEEKFYTNGTKEYFGSFDDLGQRDGEWRYYYDSGQLWSLGFYKNGKKEGKKEVYWPDGTKRYEGQFVNDLKSGTWTFYNPDGTVLQKMNFDAEKAN